MQGATQIYTIYKTEICLQHQLTKKEVFNLRQWAHLYSNNNFMIKIDLIGKDSNLIYNHKKIEKN